ncbi:MAG: hypothetical protein WBA07_01510 [Rivularia sp. (in: cyanobacteria)]
MTAFEIRLNGEYICTAGVEQKGSLSAITSWLKRTDGTSEEEMKLNVGGLTEDSEGNNIFLKWIIDRSLEVGDELNIKIVQASEVDKPISEKREEANFIEEQQRRYYEKLKQKFEN